MITRFTKRLGRVLFLFLFLISIQSAKSQTFVSGVISVDSVFKLAASPFVVSGNLIVQNGATLTIEPGVVIKFNQNISMLVLGTLLADGQVGSRIKFTANTVSPSAGYWGGLSFGANSTPATYDVSSQYVSGSILNYVDFDYAGSVISGVFGAIALTGNGAPFINHVTVKNCAYPGIYSKSGSNALIIRNTSVSNCQSGSSTGAYENFSGGINIRLHSNSVIIDSCTVQYNTGAGIGVVKGNGSLISISNSLVQHNTNSTTGNGGGLILDPQATVRYNRIAFNTASQGGGLYLDTIGTAGGLVQQNFIIGNTASIGAAFWGGTDSLVSNVIANNTGAGEICRVYGSQANYFNEYIGNTAPFIFRTFGPYVGADIVKNSFSNNSTSSSTSALLQFEKVPASAGENNLMDNSGYSYTMQMNNSDNTAILSAINNFWKTTGTLNSTAIQALIFDINDDINQGQITFSPFQTSPRTDCPISGVSMPIKKVIGDSLFVYWNTKVGENVAGYKVYYGGSDGISFNQFINTSTDTFCWIPISENIDTVAITAYSGTATNSIVDFITGAESWYTFANWENASNPIILSYSPTSGTFGDTIEITGSNLTGISELLFGGHVVQSYVVNSSTSITAILDKGSSGNVFVRNAIGGATLSGFNYLAKPYLISFTPQIGGIGAIIDINGFHFTGTTSVSFGGTSAASFIISGDTLIKATLGAGASGVVMVTNPFGSDTLSYFNFCAPFVLNLPDTSISCGDSVMLTASSGFASYLWTNGDTTNSTYVTNPGWNYVHVTNVLGCEENDSVFVVLNPYPTPIITGDTILCAGTSTFYKNGNEVGHAYNWNVANGSLNSGQATDSITVTWTSAGQGKIVLLDSIIATGCSVQTDTFLVNIQANPSPVISGSIQTCANKIEVYQTPKDTGRTYSWEITGGIILSGGNTDSLVVIWGNVGTGTLQVTDSNNWTGCKTTTSVFNVNINPLPTPVISGSTSVCSGGTALYTTVDNPGRGYFWTAIGGVITSGQGNDSVIVTWGAAGTGRLVVSDSNFTTGCVGTTSDYLVAILALPTPVITGDTFLCEGTSTFYKNGNEAGHGYSWNVIGGNLISGQATDSIVVTWPNSGIGKIVLTDTIQSTGCLVQTDTFYIHINANPAPVVSGLNQVCANSIAVYQTPKDTGRSYNWTIGGGVFVFGETTDSVSVRWGNAGTGTMQVVDSVNYTGCKTTSSVFNVLINDVPVPVISGSVLLCSGATALYTTPSDTGRGYFWTVNGGVIASGQGNDSVTITWAGAGTGTLIVVDSIFVTGCKGVTEAYHVTVQPNPTPVISGSDTVCSGNVKMYVTPFNPGRSYFWSITGGNINSGQSKDTIFVTWGASGNGTLMVTDSVNDAGCKTTTAAFNVAILSNPTPIIAGKLAVCVNAIESYTTTGLLGHSYSWQVVGGTIVSGQGTNSIQVLWANAGSGTIRVTDSVNATGCLGTSTPIVVSIFALPNPVVSGPTALCLGNSANYTITGNSGRTYLWTVVGGTIASGQGTSFLTVNWNVAGVGSVSVLDSVNATGCKSTSLPHDVTVFALPNPVITGANSVCNGTNMIYSTTNNSGHTYFWTVTGGTLASGQGTSNILVTWGTPGTGTISVRDSINSSGCEGTSANFNVVVNSSPTPLISGLIEICEGGNATYTTPTVSGHSYIWNVIGGTIVSGQGTPSIDVNWPLNGSGSVEVTDSITGAGCKVTTLPYLVTIDTLPTPAISGNTIICEGSSHDYSVSASTNHDYQWTVSNGIITNGQGTSTITVSWGASGLGTINVIDSNEVTGCVGSATGYLVSIIGSPAPDVSGASVVCANSSSDYSTPNNSGRNYNWTVFGGTIIMGQGTSNISIMWGSVGSGYVYVTDSIEATGCVGTSSVFNVSISSNPTAVISGTFVRCVDNEAIYGTFNNTGRSFNWDVIGGTIQSGQSTASITVLWDMVGTGYVMLTDSITGSGCKASTFREVTVNPNPVGSFIVTQSGGIVTGIPDESGAYYTWDFGDGFNSSLANPSHLYATNGTYTISLVVRNQLGCAAFSSQSIDVTSVGLDAALAENFAIKAYPNPFYSTTKIGVNLSQSDVVEIEIFDLTGRNLGALKPSERLAIGEHVFEFNSDNFALGSSVYLVRIKVGDTYRFLKIIDIGKD